MAKKTNVGERKSAAAMLTIGSPGPLFELVRLLARHAAQQDFMQPEAKDDEHHGQTD